MINRIHDRVHGTLKEDAGIFPAGTRYDANNPELKLWVLNTITDSTLLVYERFVAPLSDAERQEYYSDSLLVARLFDIPDELIPPTYLDFRCYMRNMLEGDVVTVSNTGRRIARELFSPSVEGTLLFLGSAIGIGLLPERLRNEFEFKWRYRHESWVSRAATVSRRIRGHLPSIICTSPMATWSHFRGLVGAQ
jgi:uncharacterized protein (DUF2236 family)